MVTPVGNENIAWLLVTLPAPPAPRIARNDPGPSVISPAGHSGTSARAVAAAAPSMIKASVV